MVAKFISQNGATIAAQNLALRLGVANRPNLIRVFPRHRRGQLTGYVAGITMDNSLYYVREEDLAA